jgi:hypothetical protein
MTLLETLIAVSILSILLVFVFGLFRELSEVNRMTEQAQKAGFQRRYLESRLQFISERIVNENDSARKFFFYTQPANRQFSSAPSLIFTFHNEVRLDPNFSGDVLARLYVDLDKCLCLAIWPLHVSDPYQYLQEEVLMDHVLDIRYSFYAAPEKVKDSKDIVVKQNEPVKKTPEKDKWHDEWATTYEQMPSIMKIILTVEKNDSQSKKKEKDQSKEYFFEFVLPSSKNYVHYPAGDLSS